MVADRDGRRGCGRAREVRRWWALPAAALIATATAAAGPSGFASAAEVQAIVDALGRGMRPGQIFAMKPLVRAGVSVAAVEYWTGAGKPALHPHDAEYAIVVAGSGTLLSGGTLVDAHATNSGLTEGSRIEGGSTRHLAVGDVILIPAGVPHGFGVESGRLALLGIKLPQP